MSVTCELMPPDPTRLDPPIAFAVTFVIPPVPAVRAVVHLDGLRGYAGGRPGDPTPEDRAAEEQLFDVHSIQILLTHIGVDGRPTFALEAPPATSGEGGR